MIEILKKIWQWLGGTRLNTIITALTSLFGSNGLIVIGIIAVFSFFGWKIRNAN